LLQIGKAKDLSAPLRILLLSLPPQAGAI
jgi:hypothetical protein